MPSSNKSRRWVFTALIFIFLCFHQLSRYVLTPLTTQAGQPDSAGSVQLNPAGLVSLAAALIVYPVWGYLYDCHTRRKLIPTASFLWSLSSFLMGVAPTTSTYLISSAVGGLDDASYSGIFALVGDFFSPKNRGKILGLLFIAQPLAILVGIVYECRAGETVQRNWFFIFSFIALVFTLLIFALMREPRRGGREPALAKSTLRGFYIWDWEQAKDDLRCPVMLLIFGSGFVNCIPYAVLSVYLLLFMKSVLNIPVAELYARFSPALLALILGYPLGGFLGDSLFQKFKVGRILPNILGCTLSSLFLLLAFRSLENSVSAAMLRMVLAGLFMGLVRPNLAASIQDVIIPELRSTALGFFLLFEALGEFSGILLVMLLLRWMTLGGAILLVCIGAWLIGFLFQVILIKYLPLGIEALRQHMAYRSYLESRLEKLAGVRENQ